METPQEVRNTVVNEITNRFPMLMSEEAYALADAIIPLAQIPLAPATEPEIDSIRKECGIGSLVVSRVIDLWLSRRNSPPQYSLVETIEELLCDAPLCSKPQLAAIHEVAVKIAAAVRQEE